MKQFSFWAKRNKWYARIVIIFSYFLLSISGFFVGDILDSMNRVFNPLFCFSIFILAFIGFVIYPSKILKSRYKNFYVVQKLADGILITSTFLFTIYFGDTLNENKAEAVFPAYGISFVNHFSFSSEQTSFFKRHSSISKNDSQKTLNNKINQLRKHYKGLTKTQKVLLIILSIMIASGLTMLLTLLSCSLACSGSGVAALVVLILGTAGIIFGLNRLIQLITGKRKKKQKEMTKQSSSSVIS